jgi:hypothetical protein
MAAVTAAVVVLCVSACGGKSAAQVQKDRQACWGGTLASWVTTSYADWAKQIQDSGLSGGPPESQSTYHSQVFTDASYYEAGQDSPGGINGDERTEFAKVQAKCGKLKVNAQSSS